METKLAKQIAANAKAAFAKHECQQILDAGDFRAWKCADPETCIHAYTVYAVPGRLILCGDLGAMMFERTFDMVPWIRRNLHATQYIASKVPSEIKRTQFSAEVAQQWIDTERAEIAATEDGDLAFDREEKNAALDRLEEVLEEGCEHDFWTEARDCSAVLWDEWPSFEDYTPSFYWALRCLEWWLNAIAQPVEA